MVDKIENVQRGDLIELGLKANAKKILEAQLIFIPDYSDETQISGRSYVGYVAEIKPDSISLASGWNWINNKIPDDAGGIRFYLDIIATYSRLRYD